jgi:NADH dehydrogenase
MAGTRERLRLARPRLAIGVLGGSGFVGTALVTRLANDGHRVRVLSRRAASSAHLRVLPNVEFAIGNVAAPQFLARAFEELDSVVNLVGILNERGRSGAGFRAAHVQLTADALAAARSQRVARFVQMSSLGADVATGASHYQRTKGEAEVLVRAAGTDLEFAILKPSVIFGARDSLTRRFAALLRVSRGWLPLARPHARFAPIHVGDVVEALARVVAPGSPGGRAFELCGPEVMTLAQLVRTVARLENLPCHLVPLPDAIAYLQACVMEFVPGKPFSLDNYRSLAVDNVCADDGCHRLGIMPRSLDAVAGTHTAARRA